ncbi:hypothetical protein GCM10009839_18100 [Catenulispora yoronensis]|uniref:DUF892 family protein n=1 Tax=Catenulispora yoronensis TaxID=450799 RepID=A0ABP5FBN3_9ACTN
MSTLNKRFLSIYLNDHLTVATIGRDLARRAIRATHDQDEHNRLRKIGRELAEDAESLREIMRRLEIRVDPIKAFAGWLGEKMGRLKLNGHLLRRSPLSDLVELEAMSTGVSANLAGWSLLREMAAAAEGLDIHELDRLIDRAESQLAVLERIRLRVGASALASDREQEAEFRGDSVIDSAMDALSQR